MKAELGKIYRTRDGSIVSVEEIRCGDIALLSDGRCVYEKTGCNSGESLSGDYSRSFPQDLIEKIRKSSIGDIEVKTTVKGVKTGRFGPCGGLEINEVRNDGNINLRILSKVTGYSKEELSEFKEMLVEILKVMK